MKPACADWRRLLSHRVAGPLAVALAVLVLVISEAGYQAIDQVAAQRAAAVEVRLAVERTRRVILMMESAERGYMLTGRAGYREPYDALRLEVPVVVAELQALAESHPQQQKALRALAEAFEAKASELAEVMLRFEKGDTAMAMELMLTDIGREQMERIRTLGDEVQAEEEQAYRRSGELRTRVRWWSRAAIAAMVLVCLVAVFAAVRLNRERERERGRHLDDLAAERDKLEGEVARRTAELTDLARHLQSVREDERSRLARELHDELGGLLTAAKLEVARLRRRVQDQGPEVAERIDHLGGTLDAGIALKRRIIEDLRPSSLSNLGLKRTLEILCTEFAARAEIAVAADVEDLSLGDERSLAVYRCVQEALTNVAKYAQARRVRVVLRADDGRARLSVEDDGRGFDPARIRSGAHGLAGMRFRMQSCGGELVLHSAPGAGTCLQASLPL
jgi:signal transduction histidine kinase